MRRTGRAGELIEINLDTARLTATEAARAIISAGGVSG